MTAQGGPLDEAIGDGAKEAVADAEVEISQEEEKRVRALPDLEQTKTTVLNGLTSASGQRTYDHAIREFVAWYCAEPRLAFNRTVVLRYRIHLEQRTGMRLPRSTFGSPRLVAWRTRLPTPAS